MIDVTHDGDDRGAGDLDHTGRIFEEALNSLVLQLLFHANDLCIRAKLTGNVLDQLSFERLIDGNEDPLHQQGSDQILTANVKLFSEILYADSFRHRDGLGDRQRLARDLLSAITWWRLEALHRAFLGLLVTLTST